MNILQYNPYRILGVYSNSPAKERLANHNRMKAFLKVGKPVSFPLDLPQYLSPIQRTEAIISDADAKLTLPKDQIYYSQFWLVNISPLDKVALNHLISGNIIKAEEIWKKKESASSLQNLVVCSLLRSDFKSAVAYSEKLYGNAQYVSQLFSSVVGGGDKFDVKKLGFSFLDILSEEIGASALLPLISSALWKHYVGEMAIKPLVDSIQDAIDIAKQTKGKGAKARLDAGEELIKNTKSSFQQLKSLLSPSDLQFQIIADKLGLAILQCAIDYYNESEGSYAAIKAMELQKYAGSIVVGQMAKDRCEENVKILQKIINRLPPTEVWNEDQAIRKELHNYCSTPDEISYAVTLLNNTKPYLQIIKSKLGATNEYYLKLSTEVVGNALHNIIAEVNEAQSGLKDNKYGNSLFPEYSHLISVLKAAWKATEIMDSFDMESDFKRERYDKNRSLLKGLCEQLGVSTSKYTTPKQSPRYSSSVSSSRTATTATKQNKKESNSSDNNSGCIILFIIILAVFFISLTLAKSCQPPTFYSDEALLDSCAVADSVVDTPYIYETPIETELYEGSEYINNRLKTGKKPYKAYYGKARTGGNWLDFDTSGDYDYVVIVKSYDTQEVMNHVYIRGGESARLYLPDGIFSVYFYSGKGWNPNKENGNVTGGFVLGESMQKDDFVELYNQYGEYNLYPVQNGNLHLSTTSIEEGL